MQMQMDISLVAERGADFSFDPITGTPTHRHSLWRIWDRSKPLVMFIGLNPSTANADTDDPTIESVTRLCKFNGYGGFYMMNCWSYISTDPKKLYPEPERDKENIQWLQNISGRCQDVVFAWGNFKVVSQYNKDRMLRELFPTAKCITLNKNGTPGHPLFKKGTIKFIDYK